jgi:hypothetical protein
MELLPEESKSRKALTNGSPKPKISPWQQQKGRAKTYFKEEKSMNSKKNSFKRVAAGALAVLTVAAYTTPAANVGGLLNTSVLTAEAADATTNAFKFDVSLKEVLTSVSDGVDTYSNKMIDALAQNSIELRVGKKATIKSQTPLTFTFGNDVEVEKTEAISSTKVKTGYKAVVTTAFTVTVNGEDVDYNVGQVIEAGTVIASANQSKCKYYQIALTSAKNAYSSSGNTTDGYTYTFTVPKTETYGALTANAKTTDYELINEENETFPEVTGYSGTAKCTAPVEGLCIYKADTDDQPGVVYQNQKVSIVADDCFKVDIWDGNKATSHVIKNANYCADSTSPYYGRYFVTVNTLIFDNTVDAYKTYFLINKTTPSISYSLTDSNSKLKATGSGIDMVAAEFTATSYPYLYDKTIKDYVYPEESDDNDKKYALAANSSAQANKSVVTLSLGRAKDPKGTFFKESTNGDLGTLKITYNGKELDKENPDKNPAFVEKDGDEIENWSYADLLAEVKDYDGTGDAPEFGFKAAGSYVVTYTVYVPNKSGGTDTKTITYKFTIDTLEALTAKNVKLAFDEENSSAGVKDLLVCDNNDEPVIKLVDGVYTVEVQEGKKLGSKTVALTATLYEDAKHTTVFHANGEGENDPDFVSINGALKVSSVNKTQTINVTYNDPEFGTSDQNIQLKWKVANAAKTVLVLDADTYSAVVREGEFDIAEAKELCDEYREDATSWGYRPESVFIPVDDASKLDDEIKENITVVNGSVDNITYEYVDGAGAMVDREDLGTHKSGLPTAKGSYSVFILYNGVVNNVIDVNIGEKFLRAAPLKVQKNFTYGTKLFTEKDIDYKDAAGNKVDITVTGAKIEIHELVPVPEEYRKFINDEGMLEVPWGTDIWSEKTYDVNGVPCWDEGVFMFEDATKKSSNMIIDEDGDVHHIGDGVAYEAGDLLPAGNYLVTIGSDWEDGVNKTKLSKSTYDLYDFECVVTVAKKQLTENMVLIDAQQYDGRTKTITDNELHAADSKVVLNGGAYDIGVKIADGASTGKNAKGYTVDVTVDDDETNYEGTVSVSWYIVKEGNMLDGLKWNDAKTTIYSNGKIHFQFERPDNSNLEASVSEFGILVEKNGKIAAPDFDDEEGVTATERYMSAKMGGEFYSIDSEDEGVVSAYTNLQYGNNMVASGKQSSTQAKQDGGKYCGVNVTVEDVNVGAWARPYLVLSNGSIYYGEVRYLNLVNEATDKLNLEITKVGEDGEQVAQPANTRASVLENLTAAEKKDKATWRQDVESGYNEATGKYYVYASYNLSEDTEVKADAVQEFGFVADKAGAISLVGANNYEEAQAIVAEKLLIGKNFTEGRAQKNSKTMDPDEVGANVSPVNSVTGVWVRSFVDFGNNLVVYTDPVYIASVSEQYTGYKPQLDIVNADDSDDGKRHFEVKLNNIPDNSDDTEATVKKVGVVIDENASFFQLDKDTNSYNPLENADPYSTLIIDNALAKSFIANGKAPASGAVKYEGTLLPKVTKYSGGQADVPVVARAYVTYAINGVNVTIYSDPIVSINTQDDAEEWIDLFD